MAEQNIISTIPAKAQTPAPAKTDDKTEALNAELLAIKLESDKIELETKKLLLETAKFDLENQQLTLRTKRAEAQDIEERLAERELKRETNRQKALTNGQTLKQIESNEKAHQKKCNHRKGGNGAAGVVGGKGDSTDYAVIKHTFAHGDTWVRCQRCGKTWKPPVKSQYTNSETSKFDDYGFESAMRIYENALEFQTKNITSAGVPFRFSDDGEHYREQTKSVSLR